MRPLTLIPLVLLAAAFHTLSCTSPPLPAPQPPPTDPPPEAIRIRVSPRLVLPPITTPIRVDILIARHPDNRFYCFEVDGPGLYSQSCEEIPGLDARFHFPKFIVRVPDFGHYLIRATLHRAPEPTQVFDFAYDVVTSGAVPASLVR